MSKFGTNGVSTAMNSAAKVNENAYMAAESAKNLDALKQQLQGAEPEVPQHGK